MVGCTPRSEPRARYDEARTQFRQGYIDTALKLADEGYRDLAPRDAVWSWRFRLLKSETLLWKSEFQEANGLLADQPPVNSPFDIAVRRKILQGRALCRLGKPAESEAVLNEAQHLLTTSAHDLEAELAFARGKCASSADRAAARSYYQQSADLAHGVDGFIEARGIESVGFFLFKDGNYYRAIDTLNKALPISDSRLLREATLGTLAECYAELGDWRKSISLAEQAEELARAIQNSGDQEKWLIDLGRAHLALREFDKAEPYFIQALAIARGRKDQDGVARCLNDLTQLALKRHDLGTAEKYWKEESALNLGTEGRAYVNFDAAKIAIERRDFPKAEQLLKDVLSVKTNDSLRLTTQRELGNVYWQLSKTGEADRTFREAINNAEIFISQLPPEHRMSFLDMDGFYDSYMRFLVAQGKTGEALKVAERGRAQILSQAFGADEKRKPTLDLAALQAVLQKRKQIALAYALTDDESFLWVIMPAQLKLFRLPSHKLLHPQIDAYNREVVEHPRAIEDAPGLQELYKTLIQPAQRLIPRGSRVVVIPSKILSLVNFEALVVPGDHPHYWIDDVEIETASSLALLSPPTSAGKTATRKKELFLLGAPLPADNSLPVLKHAAEEMDRVRAHFPSGTETIVSGKEAVPQAYGSSNPGDYRFIHVDAHSVASDLSPLDSFVVLSPTEGNSFKLYAHEIQRTRLRADLVTLSACYSAGTRWYNGEGIVGLGWAFLRAGAHQVVASLWAVDDASTPQLMDDFYGELSRGKSAAEALRDAKLNMLHSGGQRSRPYYWASLQLYTGS